MPMRSFSPRPYFRVAVSLVFLGAVGIALADVVVDWNAAMTGYGESQPPPGDPPLELRAYAIAHIAMFNAIERATSGRGPGGESETRGHAEAAAAQAAHDVLVKALPGNGAAGFDALLARQLASIPNSAEKEAGQKIGAEAATAVLLARASDGVASSEGTYTPGSQPGDYQFTSPFDRAPFNGFVTHPKLGTATPFVLKSGAQFRAPPPYSVRDPEYGFDFNEVKALGACISTGRTDDQADTARFWFESCGFSWNRIARILAAQNPDSLIEQARLFAMLNIAMSDAVIAGFDSKYTYNFWRPLTAIHQATGDGNPLTLADPDWQPLMPTPPMPDYPSTHSSLGAAAAVVLIWFFRGDEHTYSLASTRTDLKPRAFHRISDAAQENAMSRVFAGIHFRRACLAGLEQGRSIGAWVVQQAPYTSAR